jgi:hypothetical protein
LKTKSPPQPVQGKVDGPVFYPQLLSLRALHFH